MTPSTVLPRFDPLLVVHKAARQVMFDVALQVGALDASDIFAVDRCAKQVGRLVDLWPETAAVLRPLSEAMYQRDPAARHAAAAALYREVTALVASQLARQQAAEAMATPALHARHTDDALRAQRREQLARMTEADLADAVGPLGAALTPHELAQFLDDLQASVDPQAFACLSDSLRRSVEAPRWARVLRERGVAADEFFSHERPGAAVFADGVAGSGLQRRPHRADRHRLRAQ